MALTVELNELACRVGKCAELARSDAMLDLERSVYGCDYGSNGGTTRLEAELISRLLELRPGAKLLDVGAGSGWPGLYLAQLTGCDVVMVDLPLAALRIARERAAADGTCEAMRGSRGGRCSLAVQRRLIRRIEPLRCPLLYARQAGRAASLSPCRPRWLQDGVHRHRPRTLTWPSPIAGLR